MAALAENELVFTKKKEKWVVSYKQYLKDTEGLERTQKPYSIIEGIYTQQGTNELKEIFGDGKAFSFPKPRTLVQHLLQFATDKNSLVLDSFAGSGTTGHAVLALNKEDGGARRFILVEMDEKICQTITAERLRRAIRGYTYTNPKGGKVAVEGLGGGFRYCTLGAPLFDQTGNIADGVTFADLARHIYFTETGEPMPEGKKGRLSPLMGVQDDIAYYLLYNGAAGTEESVLTARTLRALPPHDGPRVIYGESCRLSPARLKQERITFKQIPYQIRVS